MQLADSDRNVDLYHWFSSAWYGTLSILVAEHLATHLTGGCSIRTSGTLPIPDEVLVHFSN